MNRAHVHTHIRTTSSRRRRISRGEASNRDAGDGRERARGDGDGDGDGRPSGCVEPPARGFSHRVIASSGEGASGIHRPSSIVHRPSSRRRDVDAFLPTHRIGRRVSRPAGEESAGGSRVSRGRNEGCFVDERRRTRRGIAPTNDGGRRRTRDRRRLGWRLGWRPWARTRGTDGRRRRQGRRRAVDTDRFLIGGARWMIRCGRATCTCSWWTTNASVER